MNFKFDDKDYDSDKLSDNGKLYLGKLQNINAKEQQLSLEFQDLGILKAKYTELLKAELPKDEEVKEDKVVQLKPKAKQTRKKKNEQVDLAQD